MHRRQQYMNGASRIAMRHSGIASIGEETGGIPLGGGNGQQTQQQPQNNGGNSSDSGQQGQQGQNNTGSGFDAQAFWNEPSPDTGKTPSGDSVAKPDSGGGNQQQQDFATTLREEMSKVNYGDVFTKENADLIANGDLSGINQAIQGKMQQVQQHSVMFAAKLMQANNDRIMSKVEALLDGKFGNRDNTETLAKEFKGYADPGFKPVVDGVFAQAMKLSGGDRKKAIESTKEMLKYLGKTGAQDFGLNTPPGNAEDSYGSTDASKSLIDELLGRK
jgi:hypothetical protein